MSKQLLVTSEQGRVLTIKIDNPPANFLTSAIMAQLNSLLIELEKRNDIGAVIITGAVQNIFLTHFDVDDIESAVNSIPFAMPTALVQMLTTSENTLDYVPYARQLLKHTPMAGVSDMNIFHEVTARMRAMNKVFIAAINGRAMGGGFELALACDMRLMVEGEASDGIMVGQPEILIGLIPGGGGTQMLARSLGVAKALEHCLEGQPLSPAQALELGMINKVVPATQLMAEAQTLAQRMALRSPQAIKSIKNAIYQASSMTWDSGMEVEKNAFLTAASQANTRRAMHYYIAKVRALIASGDPMTIDDFSELLAGKAVDMTIS